MLAKTKKRQIFDAVISPSQFLDRPEVLAIINKVWPLRDMPSADPRYKDAYADFRQHIINNSDWDLEYIFDERLRLFDDDEDDRFFKFLAAIVDPEFQKDEEIRISDVSKINNQLRGTGYVLRVTNYFEGLPVYEIQAETADDLGLPIHISKNNIRFYKSNEQQPATPYFKLGRDNWDDFGFKTSVILTYHADTTLPIKIGVLKVMKSDMEAHILDYLPDNFLQLSTEFCSFCGDETYYATLKQLFPNAFNSILYALRDAGIFPRISEQFEDSAIFKQSLIRYNSDEALWRTIRFKLADMSHDRGFKFRYDFKPPYSNTSIDLDFDFVYDGENNIEHRVYVLIGKNGTGKTRILSGIADQLSMPIPDKIGPLKPLFSKIFTLSYSIFDRFDIQQAHGGFNYVYCGLKKDRNEHLSERELRTRFVEAVTLIERRQLISDWREILENFISSDVLSEFFTFQSGVYNFRRNNLATSFELLSSGQHILIYVLTEMFAQIRNDSLILYDEPETHLHPNAIAELMNSILWLVKRFKSFCIIATHSPLIVQCFQSRNVLIINRNDSDIQLRTLERETFAENLTVITEDVFGNRDVDKAYLDILKQLVSRGLGYQEILDMFEEQNGLPVNLSTRLLLKSYFGKE
jgi:predicted ATPase